MRRGRQQFQCLFYRRGKIAQRLETFFVRGQLGAIGQLAMHQQVSDFFIFTVGSEVVDVVAAIMQVVAAVAHGAEGRVARGRTRQRNRFLRFERGGNWL